MFCCGINWLNCIYCEEFSKPEIIMDENILIRVIRGEATEHENTKVLEWIKESEENRKEFSELKMMWTIASAPDELAQEIELQYFKKDFLKLSVFSVKDRTFWYGFAFAASAAIIILFIGLFSGIFGSHSNNLSDKKELANHISVNQRHMYTNKGVKGKVVLPDGSTVWLNSDSKLIYPDIFSDDIREVEISGEAYFEVVKDSIKPMIVKASKGFVIKVLGTIFSVKSYENDLESKAILYNGSIKLITDPNRDGQEVVIDLKPNDCAIIGGDGTTRITQIDKRNDIAWLKGEIVFEDTPMSEVLKVIERWYGKDFNVKDSTFFKYKLNATFKSESLVQILDIISLCTSIKYRIEDEKIIFQ